MTTTQLASKVRNTAARPILLRQEEPISAALVHRLCDESRRSMRSDLATAVALAEAACAAARHVSDRRALAEALRMRGHVSHLTGNNRKALAAYSRAVTLLEKLGADVDAGRTRSSALQSLVYLGRYEEALDWANRARLIFEQQDDRLRLARLDSNQANILHRQDHYVEALVLYGRAVEELRRQGDLESAGIAIRNMAVCHTALYEFDRAIACYSEAEALYQHKQLPLLAAEIGDNIAQLYYLRGDYIQALQAYRKANIEGRANTYQTAVARLDQSELLLELNLFTEAAELAAGAVQRFLKLGIPYERAKALLNQAIAVFRTGDPTPALRLLHQARRLFQREGSPVWAATADFYQAGFLLEMGDLAAARESAASAVTTLDASPLATKAIPALLLLSRIELLAGDPTAAQACLQRAQQKGLAANTLPLRFQLMMQAGQLCEAELDIPAAWSAYLQARDILETIRGQFGSDGLRISFVADKMDCYTRLVALATRGAAPCPLHLVLEFVEQAKSRSLAEAIVADVEVPTQTETHAMRSLRQQLSWCYHELDRAGASKAPASTADPLQSKIREIEERLSAEWSSRASGPLPGAPSARFSLEGLQACLGPDESLLEYFVVGDDLLGFVIRQSGIHVCPLGPMSTVEQACRRLRFQMSRGVWSGSLVARDDKAWLAGTLHHLQRLYQLLIAPMSPWLSAGHWIVVPHGILHRVPFHALHTGASYVIDERTFSYAPSSAVYWHGQLRSPSQGSGAAVFAAADERAPQILEEALAIAGHISGSRRFLGPEATLPAWFQHAGRSRLIHLATHGIFREDNPLFSSLRLSDGRLCLYDLYGMRLDAELITLSGCATGVHESLGGDEIMGLTRGLLIAGARAAQVSLWDVDDRAATRYMTAFYASIRDGRTLADAARDASFTARESDAHPFYWAPFVLTGRVKNPVSGIFSREEFHPDGVGTA